MLTISKGCGGLKNIKSGYKDIYTENKIGGFTTKKIVTDTPIKGDGTILSAQGLGKDGLNIAVMTKKLGFNVTPFIVKNEMGKELWDERLETAFWFHKKQGLPLRIIDTNYYDIRSEKHLTQGFFPEFIIIPLAYHLNSQAIHNGIHIQYQNFRESDYALHCPQATIFGLEMVGKVTGIPISSPHIGLTNYGAQKLFGETNKELLPFQRSCQKGLPWCNNCFKCYDHYMVCKILGYNTDKMKLSPTNFDLEMIRRSIVNHGGVGSIQNLQVYGKYRFNKEPDLWVTGVNKPAYDTCYKGKEYLDYIAETLEVYKHDPGRDGYGWTSNPSVWNKVIEKGYLEAYNDYNNSGNKTTDN